MILYEEALLISSHIRKLQNELDNLTNGNDRLEVGYENKTTPDCLGLVNATENVFMITYMRRTG